MQNFVGWWVTAFTTFILYQLISGNTPRNSPAKFDRLAMLSYLVTALGIVLVSLVSEAGELALIGFFAMLPWVIAGWLGVADVPPPGTAAGA